jgi:hypothetical protein
MEWTVFVHIRELVHQKELDDGWLHATDRDVKRRHLRVVCQQIRVRLLFEHEKRDDFRRHIFDGEVEVRLPDLF